jgi:hypothetical protein
MSALRIWHGVPLTTVHYELTLGYDATTLCVPGPSLPPEQVIMQNVDHPRGETFSDAEMRDYGEGIAKCLGGRLLAICQVEVAP